MGEYPVLRLLSPLAIRRIGISLRLITGQVEEQRKWEGGGGTYILRAF